MSETYRIEAEYTDGDIIHLYNELFDGDTDSCDTAKRLLLLDWGFTVTPVAAQPTMLTEDESKIVGKVLREHQQTYKHLGEAKPSAAMTQFTIDESAARGELLESAIAKLTSLRTQAQGVVLTREQASHIHKVWWNEGCLDDCSICDSIRKGLDAQLKAGGNG